MKVMTFLYLVPGGPQGRAVSLLSFYCMAGNFPSIRGGGGHSRNTSWMHESMVVFPQRQSHLILITDSCEVQETDRYVPDIYLTSRAQSLVSISELSLSQSTVRYKESEMSMPLTQGGHEVVREGPINTWGSLESWKGSKHPFDPQMKGAYSRKRL